MASRKKPASAATARPSRRSPMKRTKPEKPKGKQPPPKVRAGELGAVVFKEENGDGVTAKELHRRIAVRAAVSPAFIAALTRDFQRHGAEAIAKTRELAPATYTRLSAVLLPSDAPLPDALPEPAAPGGAASLFRPEEALALLREIEEIRASILAEEAQAESANDSAAPSAPEDGDADGAS